MDLIFTGKVFFMISLAKLFMMAYGEEESVTIYDITLCCSFFLFSNYI